jgi:nucleoside-diphosphate-sugar epimerase
VTRTVLLTGATGFIGSRVRSLLESDPAITLRAMAHRRPAPGLSGATWSHADLGRPEELTGVCDGVDTLVHLASYIGPDAARCDLVNRAGTEALVAQALLSGTKHIVLLSTAAVYGEGVHSGIAENALTPAPVSALSQSRLAAEKPVLQAGGFVLRPMFVYGEGDRWFLPALRAALLTQPERLVDCPAKLSVISAEDLARLVHAIVREPWRLQRGSVHHANHPTPVATRDLAAAAAALDIEPGPGQPTPRVMSLLTADHWYAGDALWHTLGLRPLHENIFSGPPWTRA